MIEFLSSWAKSLGLAIIVISILEMLLPNNKTKKYVRMVFGLYIIFNILSPFIRNKDILDVNSYDLNEYIDHYTTSQTNETAKLANQALEFIKKQNGTKYEEIVEFCHGEETCKQVINYLTNNSLIYENENLWYSL